MSIRSVRKRALELLHHGYSPRNSQARIYPKWRQAYAIAKAEDNVRKLKKRKW